MNHPPSDVRNAKMQQKYHPPRWKINLHFSRKKYKATAPFRTPSTTAPSQKNWKITLLRFLPLFRAFVIYAFFSVFQDFFSIFHPSGCFLLITQPTHWPVVWYWLITFSTNCFIVICSQNTDNHTPLWTPSFFNSLILKSMFFYPHKPVQKYIFFWPCSRLEKKTQLTHPVPRLVLPKRPSYAPSRPLTPRTQNPSFLPWKFFLHEIYQYY